MSLTPTQPDLNLMKQVNRQFVSGVTVVTAMDGEKPRGLAVNAFSSVSLDPPTVMVAVQRTSSTHDCLFRATHLAINILSTEQSGRGQDIRERSPTTSSPASTGRRVPSAARCSRAAPRRWRSRSANGCRPDPSTLFVCRVLHATASDRHPMVYSAGSFFDGGALTPLG